MNIGKICKEYNITNYIINDDGSIDVYGNVFLDNYKLTELPLTFNYVSGSFYCVGNELTTLKGSPKHVGSDFICTNNKLTTLEGCPENVSGSFYCYNNKLTTLKGSPKHVGRVFNCSHNNLTDNYCDTIIGKDFYTSLEQEGLIVKKGSNKITNYKEFQKLRKRKLILNKLIK